jgi:hypothetical protein
VPSGQMRKFFGERRDHLARRRRGECWPQEGCQRNQGAPSVQSPSSNGRTAAANCQRGRSSILPPFGKSAPSLMARCWVLCTLHNAAAEFTAASLFVARSVRGQSLEAMSGFGDLRKFTDTRLGHMGRVLDPLRTGAESKSRNVAISRRILVCCPFGEEAQAQHTPPGFRTIQA